MYLATISAILKVMASSNTRRSRPCLLYTSEPDVVVELDEELKTQAVVKPEEDNQVQRAVEVVKDEIGAGNPG